MPLPLATPTFTAQDYLAWEAEQESKHEYVQGEVFVMAGASDAHVTIALNLAMALRQHLRGGPCSVFISDLKLQVRADRAFYYPDVFVTCAGGDRAQSHFKSEPILVAEVLSPATSAYDRGAKFASHRKLPSLREYVVLDSERVSVDLFRRDESGRWILYPSEAGEQVELASVDLALPLEALYADVRLEQSERKQQTRQ